MLKAVSTEQDRDSLARYYFADDQSPQVVQVVRRVVGRTTTVQIVANVTLLLVQASLIWRLLSCLDPPVPRRRLIEAACGFVLFSLSFHSTIGVGTAGETFDYLSICLYLSGVLLLLRGSHRTAAVVTAVGIMTKVFPGLLIPLYWGRLGFSPRAIGWTALAILLCLLISAPFLLADPPIYWSSFRLLAARDGWESVWTYPKIVLPFNPAPPDMPGLFDIPMPSVGGQGEAGGGIQAGLTIAVLTGLSWFFRRRMQRAEGLTLCALLYLIVLLFFAKGFSSYFISWLFPLLFVVYRPFAASLLVCLFLLVGNLELVEGSPDWPFYWTSIFARQALLLLIALHTVRQLWMLAPVETEASSPSPKRLAPEPTDGLLAG